MLSHRRFFPLLDFSLNSFTNAMPSTFSFGSQVLYLFSKPFHLILYSTPFFLEVRFPKTFLLYTIRRVHLQCLLDWHQNCLLCLVHHLALYLILLLCLLCQKVGSHPILILLKLFNQVMTIQIFFWCPSVVFISTTVPLQ